MVDRREDQASGLRRMFGRPALYALGVAGEGSTAVTMSLAGALARQGQRVLILDRNRGEAASALNLRARYELAQALDGDIRIADALVESPEGIGVLPAMRGLDRLAQGGADWRRNLEALLAPVAPPYNAWLVNGIPPPGSDADVLLVVAPTQSAIKETYAQIKTLNREARRGAMRVVVDRARSESVALTAFTSVAETARRFLGARLECLGYLPRDERAAGAGRADFDSPRGHAFMRLAETVAPATLRRAFAG